MNVCTLTSKISPDLGILIVVIGLLFWASSVALGYYIGRAREVGQGTRAAYSKVMGWLGNEKREDDPEALLIYVTDKIIAEVRKLDGTLQDRA